MDEKHIVSEFKATYQVFGTGRTPAAEIKPIGLPITISITGQKKTNYRKTIKF